MILLAELTSSEWATLVGLLAIGAGGWVAVYVKLNRIEERLDSVVGDQRKIESDATRNWEHVTKHEGQLQLIQRMCSRLLRKMKISREGE